MTKDQVIERLYDLSRYAEEDAVDATRAEDRIYRQGKSDAYKVAAQFVEAQLP